MINSICPYCGVGCGVVAQKTADTWQIEGDLQHPANRGKLCVKGNHLADTIALKNRLLRPTIAGKAVGWETAIQHIAKTFQKVINEDGAQAVALYVSGQLLIEDYYVANKWFKGFIGSANIDTNSRLCMATAVAAHKRAFGEDIVPASYADFDQARLIILVGWNPAWTHPVLYQRIAARKRQGDCKIVLIDPRKTASAAIADQHLALRSGSDGALFVGLTHFLLKQGLYDKKYVEAHTSGLASLQQQLLEDDWSLARVAAVTGLNTAEISSFYQDFADTFQTLSCFSQGINQSSSGVDKANAIINCHLLTGRIGQPGASPFSITGQPNAMGGREVGGLANQLVAHRDFAAEDRQAVADFWQAPKLAAQPGKKAVEMFNDIYNKKIKLLWIIGTNPAVSLPEQTLVAEALKRCETVIVSDGVKNDTMAHADIVLPALLWGEKTGMVTNSERCLSLQKAFLSAPGEAKADWWAISRVAQAMGFQGFDYQHPREIFCEYAALTDYLNRHGSRRALDLGALAELSLTEYLDFQPCFWPCPKEALTKTSENQRLLSDGRFFTASSQAMLIAITPQLPKNLPKQEDEYTLNTGRLRDQWHTMTRTGHSANLMSHSPWPQVVVHPNVLEKYQLSEQDWLELKTANGKVTLAVLADAGQHPDAVFVPIHWNDQFSNHSKINQLIPPITDPISGQPESKSAVVRLSKVTMAGFAALFTLAELDTNKLPQENFFWDLQKKQKGWQYHFAFTEKFCFSTWQNFLSDIDPAPWLLWQNTALAKTRALLVQETIQKIFIFSQQSLETDFSAWLNQPAKPEICQALLKNQLPSHREQILCSCHQVSVQSLEKFIQEQESVDVLSIGRALKAGSGCGSCQPEIERLIQNLKKQKVKLIEVTN